MKNNTALSIAFGGIALALSVSLNFITLFKLPFGGSVTLLRMLPLVIYSYMFGVPRGFFVCVTYSVLDCLINPQVYYPMQFILDYPLPFGLVCLAGVFRNTQYKNKILFGTLLATAGRFIPHFLSGVFFFAEYTPVEFSSAVLYSLYYQLVTVGIDMLLVMIAVFVLERNKPFMSYIDGIKNRMNMIQ